MGTWVGIAQLRLSDSRPPGALPTVPSWLLELVRDHGPVEPVVVRPLSDNNYEILSNVETWLAVQKAGQHRVLIDVRDDFGDDEAAEVVKCTLEAQSRDPIDDARDYADRLKALGGRESRGAVKMLANQVGKSRSYISHALRLLDLPERIQRMVSRGELSPGHARPLVTLGDGKKQLRLAERIVQQRLSVRAAEDLARGRRPAAMPSANSVMPATNQDPDIRRLENRISETIGCRARIDVQGGRLVMDYYGDLDVLDGILERLGCKED